MKIRKKLLFLLTPLALCLSSCDILPALSTGYIEIHCSNGGSIKTLAEEFEEYSTGIEIVLYPKANDGYKLTSLTVNGVDILDSESFKLQSDLNYVDAKFTLIDDIDEEYNYTLSSNRLLIEDVYNAQGLPVLPSLGTVKALVVPINFSDQIAFDDNDLKAIDVAFNGEYSDKTNSYWESVASYYKKSSYNKLDLSFTICDAITSPITSKEFSRRESSEDAGGVKVILDYIYDKLTLENNDINLKNYDVNKDGYVDGLWLIYNVDDVYEVYNRNNFWAYTYWNISDTATPNVNKPQFGVYANCANIFLYQDSSLGYDAHTLIHETGHMFGLDDYYTYDDKINVSSLGGLDMMDLNIGDHNAFSKIILGWVDPKIINVKNSSVVLNSFSETGECLLISNSFDDSPFNEYYLVEFYTNTNLNYLDSTHNYGEEFYTTPYNRLYDYEGVKILHVDARLLKYLDFNEYYINNGTIKDLPSFPKYYPVYTIATSNTASYSYKYDDEGRYNLIEIVTPSNQRTYGSTFLGIDKEGNEELRGLFLEGESFSSSTQSNFFINNKLHNGSSFDYKIEVQSIQDHQATIVIK